MNRGSSSHLPKKFSSGEEETIAAISTPFGVSGIGIVRISGSLAEPIATRLFRPKSKPFQFISHQFHYGEIVDPQKGHPIDEVLLVLMKAPKTYTREDILEIHCHGGYFILQKILELVLREGTRMAHPGEFTKRAFLNGRIDLTQAEAVIDLINAKTMASLEIANQQLRGNFFRELNSLKERMIEKLALIEAHLDFPEEEIEPISLGEMKHSLKEMIKKLNEWIGSYEEGRIFREGISCAIVGKTNVGKSSLLNVLLKEERAIVTPIPGTTRDLIEEVLNINGIPVRLIDTAGLRKATDSIEEEGVKRAKERVAESDFILLMVDGSRPIDIDDLEIFEEVKGKKKVVVMNKKDLSPMIPPKEMKGRFQGDPIVSISALKNKGIEGLKEAIYTLLIHREVRPSPEYLIIANVRHKKALDQVKESLSNTLKGLEKGTALEFIAFEIRSALEALGEVVGETTSEEVLNRIFEQFCIGK
ncbi:MAG TPA: tRNA uridine-5-carboxymethylaminomethyl(34) synthesis GTPase MnmE [Thermodesulfobacteriota bacterium]|nr:tRNA uridine-5-carboxymethylaminomethyl(34) synthesis GTPase MnmE [Thermodesulfobacteriota bacterium]